jgi:hypothetical protein
MDAADAVWLQAATMNRSPTVPVPVTDTDGLDVPPEATADAVFLGGVAPNVPIPEYSKAPTVPRSADVKGKVIVVSVPAATL